MTADVEAIISAAGGISLAVVGLGAVLLMPRSLSASYERELTRDRIVATAADAKLERDTYKVLAKYSAQGLAQSRTSFIVSIIFASLGFLVILGGVAATIFEGEPLTSATVPVIAGAIVDAVAGLFFTVNSRTQKVMVEFFDKLRSDHRVEDAISIAAKLPDESMAGKLQALLALQFTDAKDIPELFRQLLEHEEAPARPQHISPVGRHPGQGEKNSDPVPRSRLGEPEVLDEHS